ISKIDDINDFLTQRFDESTSLSKTIEELGSLLNERKEQAPPSRRRRKTDQ
ncbi:MAG: flagellum-specific ATP synthase FliI, partial [Phycisphaerae bacterium]|nr:flagellum-specific ATP synthase FliI [Phycisphaerae bacterium]